MIFSFHITTLGCKVNQYESQALREAWLELGWRETLRPANADVLVVNSCAVTAAAVADVRTAVRRLHAEAPLAKIIITGCSAQVVADQMLILPGVVALVGNAQKELFTKKPQAFFTSLEKVGRLIQPLTPFPHPQEIKIAPPNFPDLHIGSYTRARAVLKVQDGCSHGCTYCIVPLARGPARSRPPKEVLAELSRLLEAGFREIILSGINLRQYSAGPIATPGNLQEYPKNGPQNAPQNNGVGSLAPRDFDFWDLLHFLEENLAEKWQGKARLRLSSLEPGQLNARALKLFAKSHLICPHLHISLQSGSPSVLRRMGRGHYDPASLLDFCAALREIWPFFALGADFLMGFPGESGAEFEETFNLAKALPLTYAHVFPFSPRPGTAAAGMENQVPKDLRAQRAAAIRNLVEIKKEAFLQALCKKFADQPLHMILENDPAFAKDGGSTGLNEYYVECVLPKAPEWAKNRDCLAVRPLKVENDKLLVEPWPAA